MAYSAQSCNPELSTTAAQPYAGGPPDEDFAATLRDAGVDASSANATDGPQGTAASDGDEPMDAPLRRGVALNDGRQAGSYAGDPLHPANTAHSQHAATKAVAMKGPAHDAGKNVVAGARGAKRASAPGEQDASDSEVGGELLRDGAANDGEGAKDANAGQMPWRVALDACAQPDTADKASDGDMTAGPTSAGGGKAQWKDEACASLDTNAVDAFVPNLGVPTVEARDALASATVSGALSPLAGQAFEARFMTGIGGAPMHARGPQAAEPVRDGSAELVLRSYESPAPNQLEVGLSGGTYGWMKVRAELTSGGELHAYLRGGSTNAEEGLRSNSQQLMSFLSSHEVRLTGVHVEASGAGAGGFGGGGGTAGQEQKEPSKSAGHSSERSVGRKRVSAAEWQDESSLPLPAMMGQGLSGSGGWLSVRV